MVLIEIFNKIQRNPMTFLSTVGPFILNAREKVLFTPRLHHCQEHKKDVLRFERELSAAPDNSTSRDTIAEGVPYRIDFSLAKMFHLQEGTRAVGRARRINNLRFGINVLVRILMYRLCCVSGQFLVAAHGGVEH